MSDLISRADAIEAVHDACNYCDTCDLKDIGCSQILSLKELPSADAEPKMTEEVREALMRLTMCAREECVICKYKDKCNFDFQYEESTRNMNTILDALMRSRCEVDAKSTDAVKVVRCKDCRHYQKVSWTKEMRCVNPYWATARETVETDFCSYGERREP